MAERKDRDANVWVLVPLAALMIPIIGVANGNALVLVGVGLAFFAVAASVIARSLMDHRHELRLREIEAERRLILEDRMRFEDANRVLERDVGLGELRSLMRQVPPESESPPETEVGSAEA